MSEDGIDGMDHNHIPKYPHLLKILQEMCNIYIIISIFVIGMESQTFNFFLVVIIVTFLITAFLLANKIFDLIKINAVYLWIEFGYGSLTGSLITITTTILAMAEDKTIGNILIFITGYANAMFYFYDALDNYSAAMNSRKRVYWNRPIQVLYDEE